MAFTFRCMRCTKRKFLQEPQDGMCQLCYQETEQEKQERERKFREHQRKKELRRIKREKELNEKLKREVAEQQRLAQEKQQLSLKKKQSSFSTKREEKETDNTTSLEKSVDEKLSIFQEAQRTANTLSSVLYVYVDVKRIKAVEWLDGKERVALNKEREIRQTHKGGWSQEKFQRFVKAKKAKTLEWAQDVLSREGVLRPPYDQIFVEAQDEEMQGELHKFLEEKSLEGT